MFAEMDDSSFFDLSISNGNRNLDKKGKTKKKTKSTEEQLADNISMESPMNVSQHIEKSFLQNSLTGMSQTEIAQHHELCMRLAAENKINLKNAFGLHLIAIMKKMVKEFPDLQLASLSLAASSKIYAGRVEALYKDTYKFHSNLQCMIGKKDKGSRGNDELEGADDDPSDKGAGKSSQAKSKCKSHLTTEENLSGSQGSSVTKAHGNFVCINSAFSASRSAEKLLAFTFQNDNNKICHLLRTVRIFSTKSLAPQVNFPLPKKCKGFLEKVTFLCPEAMESEIGGLDASPIICDEGAGFSPKEPLECLFQDSLVINNVSPIREEEEEQQNSLDGIIDRFSILDITADAFAHDISRAVTDVNTVDVANLPPNSVLKKVLKGADRTRLTKSVKKPEKKVPFFNSEVQVDKSHFMKDKKKHYLTDVALSEWTLSGTSIFFRNAEFHSSLTSDCDTANDVCHEMLTFTFATNLESDMLLKQYFLRRTKAWQKQHQKPNTAVFRPSSLMLRNDLNNRDTGFSVEQDLAQCLRRLSFSSPQSPNYAECPNISSSPVPDVSLDEAYPDASPIPMNDLQANSSLEQSILENVELVSPPELVKKISVCFEKNFNTVNTEKAKTALWSIIHNHLNEKQKDSTLLSFVHKELQEQLSDTSHAKASESISLQFTFVMLLILANEKVLLLENMVENNDLLIKKDVAEIDSEKAF